MQERLLPRLAAEVALASMRVFPVTVLTGARQTGKSTLARMLGTGHQYVTLDDVLIRDLARRNPEILLDQAHSLIIDEVQHAPDLLLAVKRRVDERREPGRYILTGSSNLLLQRNVSESLAGRAGYVTLTPLTRREQLGFGSAGCWGTLLEEAPSRWQDVLRAQSAPDEPWQELARRGGYPVPAYQLDSDPDRAAWFAGYTATYLERDLQQLSAVEGLADFRRLMAVLCLRTGGLLNQAEIGRDIQLPSTTVQRYINLLEISYQLVRLPAYHINRTRRMIKASKPYWTDTALALHLAADTPRGAHLENLVLSDLQAWAPAAPQRPLLSHWRTNTGAEVDFVIEAPGRLLPIEVKAADRIRSDDARHLRTFLADYPDQAVGGLLLYTGNDVVMLDRSIIAAPWYLVM